MHIEHSPQRLKGSGGALPPLLSDQQVAAILATSRATVWRRTNDGSLPRPIKVGHCTRWLRSEIEAVIASAVAKRDGEAA